MLYNKKALQGCLQNLLFFSLNFTMKFTFWSFLQSMAILTFNFASSFSYATIFLFTLQFFKISRPDIKLSDNNRSSFSLVEK